MNTTENPIPKVTEACTAVACPDWLTAAVTADDVADNGRVRVGGSFRLPTSRG